MRAASYAGESNAVAGKCLGELQIVRPHTVLNAAAALLSNPPVSYYHPYFHVCPLCIVVVSFKERFAPVLLFVVTLYNDSNGLNARWFATPCA